MLLINLSVAKEYQYSYMGKEFIVESSDSDQGFKKAANDCFDYYEDKIDSKDLEDLIDVCANPR